jgi:hypothetical protein
MPTATAAARTARALALAARLDALGADYASEAAYLRAGIAEGWLRDKDVEQAEVVSYC